MVKKILVTGLGTIGKRVYEAIDKQDDMELLGIGDVIVNYNIQNAVNNGINIYTTPDRTEFFEDHGINPTGTIQEGAQKADLVLDATPAGIGKKNKKKYEKADTKAIFQGGESASVADAAFNSFWNYEDVKDVKYVQVVSCNTTALCRIVYALKDFGVDRVRGVLVRRGGDPKQTDRGPLNAIVPKHHIPSHHAEDVQRCIPDLDITTVALKVPTTLMHAHSLNFTLDDAPTKEEILEQFKETPRIITADEELGNTAKIVEWARDMGRKRYDVPEVVVWPGTVKVEDDEVWVSYAVHQESIAVPENIDAIRAMLGIEKRARKSRRKTNNTLGIRNTLEL